MFTAVLKRRKFMAILMGGGSPCQGNSELNKNRKGWGDERSQGPLHIKRLHDEFKALPAAQGVPVLRFLENVHSMEDQTRRIYDSILGVPALAIQAGQCGWCQRTRLYWAAGPRGGITALPRPTLPDGWSMQQDRSGHFNASYAGPKPIPTRVPFSEGFAPIFDPKEVVCAGKGGMSTFTREFYHPDDRVSRSSAEASERFYADSRRFPPSSYEANSLLWKQDKWRQPSPAERATMMGLPPDLLEGLPRAQSPALRIAAQNSAVGNGFHIPSVMLVFMLLLQTLEAKHVQPCMYDCNEQWLAERLAGTAWEPGRTC
jgi:hypothetical protein